LCGVALSYSLITEWLISIGALELRNSFDGKAKKYPTPQGVELGITNETRSGINGEYNVVVYNKDAQLLIVDNIEAIVALKNESKEKATENRGQAWTLAQEECLIELFNKNVPVSEIAVTLMRTESGIRARLKKLGLKQYCYVEWRVSGDSLTSGLWGQSSVLAKTALLACK